MEDLLAMKDSARSADFQRKHRGPVRTDLAMDNTSQIPSEEIKNCYECDLWWWVQKLKDQLHLERVSQRPVIKGDFNSNWSHYMSTNLAHQISKMSIARYKEFAGDSVRSQAKRDSNAKRMSVVSPNVKEENESGVPIVGKEIE